MSSGDGLDLLKPFLPGLEAALEDPDVSEIMINGPGNVWLEGHGRLSQIDAPALDAAALERAAIHIARPLGPRPGDHAGPRCAPGGRLARGDLCPTGQPARRDHRAAVRQTILFSGAACRTRRAPGERPPRGRADPPHAPQYPGERRHRQRQDDAPKCAHRTHPRRRADRGDRGHLGAADRLSELRPLRGARAAKRRRHDPRPGASRLAAPT